MSKRIGEPGKRLRFSVKGKRQRLTPYFNDSHVIKFAHCSKTDRHYATRSQAWRKKRVYENFPNGCFSVAQDCCCFWFLTSWSHLFQFLFHIYLFMGFFSYNRNSSPWIGHLWLPYLQTWKSRLQGGQLFNTLSFFHPNFHFSTFLLLNSFFFFFSFFGFFFLIIIGW